MDSGNVFKLTDIIPKSHLIPKLSSKNAFLPKGQQHKRSNPNPASYPRYWFQGFKRITMWTGHNKIRMSTVVCVGETVWSKSQLLSLLYINWMHEYKMKFSMILNKKNIAFEYPCRSQDEIKLDMHTHKFHMEMNFFPSIKKTLTNAKLGNYERFYGELKLIYGNEN